MAKLDQLRAQMPPHNLEAEESVLGAILLEPAIIDDVSTVLTPDDFYDDRNARLFARMLDLHQQREPIDLVTLCDLLKARGELELVGGAYRVSAFGEQVPTAANAGTYAAIVRDRAVQRQLTTTATKIALKASEPCTDVAALVADAETRILAVGDHAGPALVVTAREAALAAQQHLLQRDVDRIPTGFATIDSRLGGFLRGTLVVAGGRTGTGKSTVAQRLALGGAIEADIGVLYYSLEMGREELMLRAVANRTSIPNWRLQRSDLSESQHAEAAGALVELSELPWFIQDVAAPWERALSTLERTLRLHPEIGLVVVDHVGLVRGVEGGSIEHRHLVIGEITSTLVDLARRRNIVVLLVSQLNRDCEKQGREPMLSDLRESGSLEQDASMVLFLHLPEGDASGDDEQQLHLIVAKNRQGPIGRFRLRYVKQFCRITDPED